MVFFVAMLYACMLSAQQTPPTSYKVINKIHLPGDGRWDYLYSDDEAGRLYVSHGDRVQVVDEKSNSLVGEITGLNGVHGITVAPALNKGFITGGGDSSLTVFDTKSLKVLEKIIVTGEKPDAVLFDAFSDKVFVFNANSDNATVVDAKSDKILATIELAGNPEFSVSDGKGMIYVNIENKSLVTAIDPVSCKVIKSWSLSPGEEPSGLALDNVNHLLFSVCSNKLMVVSDAVSGKVVATVPIGEHPDGAAFDPVLKTAYSSNGDGTLTIVKEEKGGYKVLDNLKTQKSARTICLNKVKHHLYLSAADFEAPVDGKRAQLKPNSFVVLEIKP